MSVSAGDKSVLTSKVDLDASSSAETPLLFLRERAYACPPRDRLAFAQRRTLLGAQFALRGLYTPSV